MKRYTKISVLGKGTYGEVIKAYLNDEDSDDGSSKRLVAIKKLYIKDQEKNGIDITAIRDIKFLRELKHENIIEV